MDAVPVFAWRAVGEFFEFLIEVRFGSKSDAERDINNFHRPAFWRREFFHGGIDSSLGDKF